MLKLFIEIIYRNSEITVVVCFCSSLPLPPLKLVSELAKFVFSPLDPFVDDATEASLKHLRSDDHAQLLAATVREHGAVDSGDNRDCVVGCTKEHAKHNRSSDLNNS